jgi:hypothetical protein
LAHTRTAERSTDESLERPVPWRRYRGLDRRPAATKGARAFSSLERFFGVQVDFVGDAVETEANGFSAIRAV